MPSSEYARWETGNSFLDTLTAKSASSILPMLAETTLEVSRTIAHSGAPIEQVVFPKRSVISAVTRMRDGTDIEVLLIGREGFHGLQAVLGDGISTSEAMVQLADSAYLVPVRDFIKATQNDSALLGRVLRYAQTQIDTIAQFSGCNRLHQLDERCARWLLMVHDRVVSDEIFLTHEFLATMLGVRRAGVRSHCRPSNVPDSSITSVAASKSRIVRASSSWRASATSRRAPFLNA